MDDHGEYGIIYANESTSSVAKVKTFEDIKNGIMPNKLFEVLSGIPCRKVYGLRMLLLAARSIAMSLP